MTSCLAVGWHAPWLGSVYAVQADVSLEDGRTCLLDTIGDVFGGKLNVLVNSVGTNSKRDDSDTMLQKLSKEIRNEISMPHWLTFLVYLCVSSS